MGKYLRYVHMNYSFEYNKNEVFEHVVLEAIVSYRFLFEKKSKLQAGGIAKVTLIGGSEKKHIKEELIDILIYEHPYVFINKLNANSTVETVVLAYINEVTSALTDLALLKGWDPEPIQSVKNMIEEKQFKFQGIFGKKVFNPSRNQSISVGWRTTSMIEFYFLINDVKSKKEVSHTFFKIPISLGLFESIFGHITWQNDDVARMWLKDKRDYWEFNTKTQESRFCYVPAETGNAHGQYQLAKMYIDGNYLVEKDMNKAKEWLEKSSNQGFPRAKKLLQQLLINEKSK